MPWPPATFCFWPFKNPHGVTYQFDDTNPDARIARMLVDRDIQAAAGQREAIPARNQFVHETGSRYIDFVVQNHANFG